MAEVIREVIRDIKRRKFAPATKRALVAVARGETYRSAAEAAGGSAHQSLYSAAGTVPGLRELHLDMWAKQFGEAGVPPQFRHIVGARGTRR